jgi:hypothetical protein
MSARPITIIALVQTGIIVIGLLALGIALKMHGYPRPHLPLNPVAVALRQNWSLLLFAPLVCVVLGYWADHQPRRFFSENTVCFLAIATAAALLSLFFYGTVFTIR